MSPYLYLSGYLLLALLPASHSSPVAGFQQDSTIRDSIRKLNALSAATREQAARELGRVEPSDASVAATALVPVLDDEEAAVRDAARASLQNLGTAAVPALLRHIKEECWVGWVSDYTIGPQRSEPTCHALELLSNFGTPIVPSLCAALQDHDTAVPAAAVIKSERATDCVDGLLGNASSDDDEIAAEALNALSIAPIPVALPRLLEALGSSSDLISRGAERALLEMGAETFPSLVEQMNASDAVYRAKVARVLAVVSRHAPELREGRRKVAAGLADGLTDLDAAAKLELVRSLSSFDADAEPAVPALIDLLGDPDEEIYRSAQAALGRVGLDAAPRLERALEHPDGTIRTRVIVTLASLGSYGSGTFVRSLTDEDARVRAASIDALRRRSARAAEAVPALARVLETDSVADIRVEAAEALRRFGAGAELAQPALVHALRNDSVASVRRASARALAAVSPEAPETLVVLERATEDPEAEVRGAAVLALQKLVPLVPAAEEVLIRCLSHRDPVIRTNAAVAVAGRSKAVPALISLLDDENDDVVEAAVRSLSNSRDATTSVIRALEKATPRSRSAIYRVLLWGGDVYVVVKAALEPNPNVRGIILPLLADKLDNQYFHDTIAYCRSMDPDAEFASDCDETFELDGALRTLLPRVLEDGDPTVREAAVKLTKVADWYEPEVMDRLVDRLTDGEERVREGTVSALVAAGEIAVEPLQRCLGEDDIELRAQAARVLGKMSSLETFEILEREMSRQPAEVQIALLNSLQFAPPEAFRLILLGLEASDPDICAEAMAVIAWRDPPNEQYDDKDVIEALHRIGASLRLPHQGIRTWGPWAMAKLGTPYVAKLVLDAKGQVGLSFLNSLNRLLENPDLGFRRKVASSAEPAIPSLILLLRDPELGSRASTALAGIGDAALEPLTAALQNEDPELRLAVVATLGLMGGAALDPLARALADSSARVREQAAISLGNFGPPASHDLQRALNDPDPRVRSAAKKSLEKIR